VSFAEQLCRSAENRTRLPSLPQKRSRSKTSRERKWRAVPAKVSIASAGMHCHVKLCLQSNVYLPPGLMAWNTQIKLQYSLHHSHLLFSWLAYCVLTCCTLMPAGYYALHEITAILDTQLVADPLGSLIMDKLRKCSGKPTCPCSGIKFEIQANPMRPLKSIMWQRSSVAEPGVAMKASDAENVPYILLYFTVSLEKWKYTLLMPIQTGKSATSCTLDSLVAVFIE